MLNRLMVNAVAAVSRNDGRGVIINEHTLSQKATRVHVDVLGKVFDFISIEELSDRIRSPRRKPFCLLTFDDGKKSNYTITAPELRRRGIPAVFYVTTDFISGQNCLWFDELAAYARLLPSVKGELDIRTLKELPFELLRERLDRVANRVSPAWRDQLTEDETAMSWDDVRSLLSWGFNVGSHGTRHAILTRESSATAIAEIAASVRRVSAETGRPCDTLAFPNGNHNQRLIEAALSIGVKTCLTTEPMWVFESTPLHRLPRIQLFESSRRWQIQAKLVSARVPGFVTNPDGTGRLYRRSHRYARTLMKPVPDKLRAGESQ